MAGEYSQEQFVKVLTGHCSSANWPAIVGSD
jgi:hypothetical protein